MTFAAAASTRLIAHLDMDAFYASVELLRYPELRGKPVVIGGGRRHQPRETRDPVTGSVTREFATLRGYAGRGVATTATYEARAFGVHSAMGLMKAAALAPDAILLPVDFDAYRKYSRLFKAAVRTLATVIEDRGIDEIYIDLTDVAPAGELRSAREPSSDDPWRRARDVAIAIKRAVRAATGLSCSIAVAPNKLLAKIASELDKPDGLTLLRPADIALRIWPLPPRKINGVGSEVEREARGTRHPHHRRARAGRPAVAQAAVRRALRGVAARSGARPRRAPRRDVHASPSRSAARRRSSATFPRGATAKRCRRSSPSSARASATT